ncbi:hypothetical protein NQ315_002948 [Exocentrus adspersus]|uniref:Uncharacterized protein n=1 Tax=Exocentrus adspersus TaxID=1586481 RepID=A0AAV8W4F3_9CUCU|nr:hypothetical protein NQ315_002948 [Exocentrus adspersus]
MFQTTNQTNAAVNRLESSVTLAQMSLCLDKSRVVVNLASTQLTDDAMDDLAKGFNFAVASRVIPKEEISIAQETTYRRLPTDVSEDERVDPANFYGLPNPPKPNLTRQKRALGRYGITEK